MEGKGLSEIYEATFESFKKGNIVKGKVVDVDVGNVLVDINYKAEGVIPLEEFGDPSSVKAGDEIDVLLMEIENDEGRPVISKEKADQFGRWEGLVESYKNGELIEGKVLRPIRGGHAVDAGMEVFLPSSQVSFRYGRSRSGIIGKTVPLKIIKLDRQRRNVVVSNRLAVEEEEKRKKAEVLSTLEKGEKRRGVVKNITDFGVFVDLGGIEGLLHITDMSWGRISHPSEVVAVGDEIEVVVLDFDVERQRIALGLKQKSQNPWLEAVSKYPKDSRHTGRVVNVTNYGAFVELEKGVEGLVHISEMSWTRKLTHPSEMLAVGDVIEICVLSIDTDRERLSLGIRQLEPNPWELIREKYPVGSMVKGRVRNLTNYGAFIELEGGVDGLIHVSDMSWTKRVSHPSEVLKKGDKTSAVVLEVSPKNKKVLLGLKQLQGDPWEKIGEKFEIARQIEGTVTRLASFGAFVELADGIEGLIHVSELGEGGQVEAGNVLSVGQKVTVEILKIEPEERKIGLRFIS